MKANAFEVLDTITGAHYLAIETSLDVLKRRQRLDWGQSTFKVVRRGGSSAVLVADKDAQGLARKETGVALDSQTELNADAMRAMTATNAAVEVLDQVRGENLRAIQTAVDVFSKHNRDLLKYKIEVIREGDAVVVLFADKNRPEGAKGSIGEPGFEVEMKGGVVTRSNFVR